MSAKMNYAEFVFNRYDLDSSKTNEINLGHYFMADEILYQPPGITLIKHSS